MPLPADIFLQTLKEPNYAKQILDKSGEMNKELGRKKAHLSTTKVNRKKNKDQIAEYDEGIDIITKNWHSRGRYKNSKSWERYLYTKKEECL